jgi:hypothetical protein
MATVLMALLVFGLAVLLIGGAVKAARLERSAARGPRMTDYRERLTDEDRQFIAESLKNAEGVFPQNPAVALDMAHRSVATVLNARGVHARIPVRPDGPDVANASPEELRERFLRYEHFVGELTGASTRG